MVVVGVDNASNRTGVCTGWVSGPNGEHFHAHRVAVFSRLPRETAWEFGARIGEAIDADVRAMSSMNRTRTSEVDAMVLIEEPPSQVRDDVRHGPQALIGWRLGLTAGSTAAVVERSNRSEVRLCPVATWRNAMRQWAADRGIPCDPTAVAPTTSNERIDTVERTELGYLIHRSCGHADELIGSDITRAPAKCPKCGKGPKGRTRSELVTDGWKRVAVDMARRIAEPELDEIIAAARKRARRNADGPAHRLEGVSDAAEAVCIAAWGPR